MEFSSDLPELTVHFKGTVRKEVSGVGGCSEKLQRVVSAPEMRPAAFASLAVTEVRILCSPHRDWEPGPSLPNGYISKEWLPGPREKLLSYRTDA